MPMTVANKYYNSTWRRNDAHCPGGFMMESSVHFLAALRMLAAAGGAAPPQPCHDVECNSTISKTCCTLCNMQLSTLCSVSTAPGCFERISACGVAA